MTDRYLNPATYYAYDHNGDTTAITSPVNGAYTDTAAISTGLTYDAQARPLTLTKLAAAGSSGAVVPLTVTLGYNADGQRARYTVTMSGTAIDDERFQYRDDALAQVSALTATLTASGTIQRSGRYTDTYVYDPRGQPLELLRAANGQTSRYGYALDGQGSVVALTDQSGAVRGAIFMRSPYTDNIRILREELIHVQQQAEQPT